MSVTDSEEAVLTVGYTGPQAGVGRAGRVSVFRPASLAGGSPTETVRLDFNGVTADAFRYRSVNTSYRTIPGFKFDCASTSCGDSWFASTAGYVGFNAETFQYAMAPLELPDGATVTSYMITYVDQDTDDDLQCGLYRQSVNTGTLSAIEPGTLTSGASTAVRTQTETVSVTGGENVIDNAAYFYYFRCLFDDNFVGSGGLDIRLYSIRVAFTHDRTLD
jgi:hypothetical protein